MKFLSTVVFVSCLIAFQPFIIAAQHLPLNVQASQITFLAQSTLHPVHGSAPVIEGYLDVEQDKGRLEGKGDVTVAVEALDTQNVKRDRNLRNMLKQIPFPQIACRIHSIKVEHFDTQKNNDAQITGTLTIAGYERPFGVSVLLKQMNNQLFVKGVYALSLADYYLRPPSVLGIIRVKDSVQINFNVAFGPAEASAR